MDDGWNSSWGNFTNSVEILIYDFCLSQIGKKNNCTFCGVFRRQALDRGAQLLKVNYLATGHNADDIAETVLMNILRGDLARLSRCTAINTVSMKDILKCFISLLYLEIFLLAINFATLLHKTIHWYESNMLINMQDIIYIVRVTILTAYFCKITICLQFCNEQMNATVYSPRQSKIHWLFLVNNNHILHIYFKIDHGISKTWIVMNIILPSKFPSKIVCKLIWIYVQICLGF